MLGDATIRMERVIYLPGALADFGSSPDCITEMSEDRDLVRHVFERKA